MSYKLFHEKNFSRQIADACHKPALAALALFLVYTFLFIMPGTVTTTYLTVLMTLGLSTGTFLLVNYSSLPHSYLLITRNMTRDIEREEELTPKERTMLAKRLMNLPLKLCAVMVTWLSVVALVLIGCFIYLLSMDIIRALCMMVPYVFASFFSSLMVYTRSEAVCTAETHKLIILGLDDDLVRKYQCLGMRLGIRLIYHVVVPVTFSCLILAIFCLLNYPAEGSSSRYMFNGTVLLCVSLLECTVVANSFKNHTVEEVAEVNSILETVSAGNVDDVLQLPVDLGTELSYTFFCINQLMVTLQERRVQTRNNIRQLADVLDQIAASHQSITGLQSKNTVAFQSQIELQKKVQDSFSTLQSQQMNTDTVGNRIISAIDTGRFLMNENTTQLDAISQANIETISGIKRVSDQIDSVWRYISIIDDIAEKDRTIAFNTEIESTATGENAENFHIIAAEIRRLAASITESTREIRNRITDIQHSTDNLIITSEGGTEKIREESELFSTVESSFEALVISGKVTDEGYDSVRNFIQQEELLEKELLDAFDNYSEMYTRYVRMMDAVGSSAAICQLLLQEEIRV